MDNYIVINGKRAELTEEQLEKLGIKVEKKPVFTRTIDHVYYYITPSGGISCSLDDNDDYDNKAYENVNYFNDRDFAQQVAWHELLNRKLLKYAYDHDAADCDWDKSQEKKFYITRGNGTKNFYVDWAYNLKNGGDVYFNNEEVAKKVVIDVVIPFMVKYPDFVW